MKRFFLPLCLVAALLLSCTNKANTAAPAQQGGAETEQQEALLQQGWTADHVENGDLPETYGYEPEYGLQDNYFDIRIGEGSCVAVKIMDTETNRCIRFVFVNENSTTTVSQIPQGKYYLKLAYGKDWMQHETDSLTVGKFTTHAFYEKSCNVFDFGPKNSQREVNYLLEINVKDSSVENNFSTEPISESEFNGN